MIEAVLSFVSNLMQAPSLQSQRSSLKKELEELELYKILSVVKLRIRKKKYYICDCGYEAVM